VRRDLRVQSRWMRSIYLAGLYQGYYYPLRDYAPRLGYSVVDFDINQYWDAYYRDRPFYQERTQWSRPRAEGGGGTCSFLRPAPALW
jgi:uncharacterized protein YraI